MKHNNSYQVFAATHPRNSRCWPNRGLLGAVLGLSLACPLQSAANQEVDNILARATVPDGVVFEIVETDETALQQLLPLIRISIERIRAKFPRTDFAVVSHGKEEFALQTRFQSELPAIHDAVKSLVAEDIPVYVCATHAGWYGVSAEDFPDYVNVAPSGPSQINLYLELGYERVVIE